MRKIFSLLLTLLLVTACVFIITACNNDDKTDNDGTSDPAVAPSQIIKNGEPQYTIVYPDNCADDVREAAEALAAAIQEKTGVILECESDLTVSGRGAHHILIGYTEFAESTEATDGLELKADAFLIKKMSRHIVIAGHFDTSTLSAVSYFCDNLIEQNYDSATKTLNVAEHTNAGEEEILQTFNFADLSKYTIVYDPSIPDYQRAAARFSYDLNRATGVYLETVKCTDKPSSPYEILVGETNRPLSATCYRRGTELMKYRIVVENGQLQIVCGGAYSGRVCGMDIIELINNDKNGSLDAGTHNRTDLTYETREITEGADVRIMSANVLVEYGRREYPSIERAEIFAKILVDYTPDIIGCQEMASSYHASMYRYFDIIKEEYDIEYSMILEDYEGSTNHAPIIYRSDKFRVDYQKFSPPTYQPDPTRLKDYDNGQYESGIAAAKFTSIADPSLEIAMVTSHWHWEKENEVVDVPKQLLEAEQMAAIVLDMRKQFPNAHVFCTGDFNSHRFEGKYFEQFVSDIDGEIASTIAKNNRVFEESFLHQSQLIDHIIGKAGTFDVLLHAPTKNCTEVMTDHDPIFADIKFN